MSLEDLQNKKIDLMEHLRLKMFSYLSSMIIMLLINIYFKYRIYFNF